MSEKLDCRKEMAIVLPSLDPDQKFKAVVDGLIENGFEHIVIVDDGSSSEHRHWFDEAAACPRCTVIHHGINRGKGRGLKTAFGYVLEKLPEVKGVITIDGDGQHLVYDIIACGDRMLEEKERVVLGCRDFDQPGVPPRSVAGNKSTSRMFRLFFGIRLSDTQTGLRAIPREYLEEFCGIEGERFEYETNMLLQMKRLGIEFSEQPIDTVYDPEDYSSHYNAVKDSWRIFKVMSKFWVNYHSAVRYVFSSLSSWIVDNGLYLLLFTMLGASWAQSAASAVSQVIARAVSSLFNFNMNYFYVFRGENKNYWSSMGKYYCVCLPQTAVSLFCVTKWVESLSSDVSPLLAVAVKIVIEAILFCISYIIQKLWVFSEKKSKE